MASSSSTTTLLCLCVIISCLVLSHGARHLAALVEEQPLAMTYHKGPLLTGPISINLIWYGKFTAPQHAIITDFITSLSYYNFKQQPSVSTWWSTTQKYYSQSKTPMPSLMLGAQIQDESYSLGKSLKDADFTRLASRGAQHNAVNVVLTSDDVVVDGFCMSRCGSHGSTSGKFTYIWVGNSETQCPRQCAWLFHQPMYGPQTPPLVAPNGDVGVDGMVINLASMLVGTVTNPFGNGFFQGPKEAPLEAASACPGVYGKGAYPRYAGDLQVDPTSRASYNANGAHGRKYVVPALFDPSTSKCSILV